MQWLSTVSMASTLITLLAVFIGALVTWLAVRNYYEQPVNELKEEAQNLRTFNENVFKALSEAGYIEFELEDSGGMKPVFTADHGRFQIGSGSGTNGAEAKKVDAPANGVDG